MCGINGALFYDAPPQESVLREIILRCADRGQDSCGVVAWGHSGWYETKCLGGPENLAPGFLPQSTKIVINTNRSEPTTEWVRKKTLSDVQPFRSHRTAVSHNGVIANDSTLRSEYGIDAPSVIDTAIVPPLIDLLGVRGGVAALTGGLALAILDTDAGALHLYRNFLPLSIAWQPGIYYFSSETKNLPRGGIGGECVVETLPPFSGITIESSGRLLRWS